MSRRLPLFAFAFFAAVSSCLFFQKTGSKNRAFLPPAELEEGGAKKKAWQKMRFADPATGEIPAGIAFAEQLFASKMPLASASRSETWTARGPHNVGGRTRAFAFDALDENHLFAGGVSGGLWESFDGGQTWARRTPMNAHPGCVSVAQDRRAGKTNTWYYLSGEIYGTSASGGDAFYLGDGLFKSTDNGATWAPVASTTAGNPASFTSTFQSGWRVVTNPAATSDEVYMALYGGIYRSANGGASWQTCWATARRGLITAIWQ